MSYLVEDLVLRSEDIRATRDFESDDYNDLLIVERCIKVLLKSKRLSEREVRILQLFSIYRSNEVVSNKLHSHRRSVFRVFKHACDKIAFELGDYFTDEGLIDRIAIKYNLSEEEVSRLRSFIKSEFRHLILRSEYKANEYN